MKKKIAILICTVGLFFSCSPLKEKENSTHTENKQLVTQYFEYFNQHNWGKMADMYTENAEFKDPSLGNGIHKQTKQQIIEKYKALQAIFPNLKDQIVQLYPSANNQVIVEFISTGTALDSTSFELPICTIFTFENGKITKDFTYYDNFEEQ